MPARLQCQSHLCVIISSTDMVGGCFLVGVFCAKEKLRADTFSLTEFSFAFLFRKNQCKNLDRHSMA